MLVYVKSISHQIVKELRSPVVILYLLFHRLFLVIRNAVCLFKQLHLQRIKLYAKLDIHSEDANINNDCCTLDLKESETDLELIEKSFEGASALNTTEKSTLYYICGYVALKEEILCEDENELASLPPVSEFTIKLSRGKLKLLPINLYDLAQYYYAFFKARNPKCCTKIFLAAFQEIHEYTGYTFPQIDKINRRLCNCFFKAFVKRSTDDANAQKFKEQRETKRRRLSSL